MNKYGYKKENREKFPWVSKWCLFCEGRFRTQDPKKIFCSTDCRIRHWHKYNKEEVAVIQKKYRDKKKLESKVQD